MSAPGDPTGPAPEDEVLATVNIAWPDNIGSHATPVNQVLFARDQQFTDSVYMYLGLLAPPPWLTGEIAAQRVREIGNVLPIEPKGVFVLSRSRALELWQALGQHLGVLPRGEMGSDS